jgi:hypothetical protein
MGTSTGVPTGTSAGAVAEKSPRTSMICGPLGRLEAHLLSVGVF